MVGHHKDFGEVSKILEGSTPTVRYHQVSKYTIQVLKFYFSENEPPPRSHPSLPTIP